MEELEKVLPGPLGPDPEKLYTWQPPSKKRLATMKIIWQTADWVIKKSEGKPQLEWPTKDEVVLHIAQRANVSLSHAQSYIFPEVIAAIAKKGGKVV